MVAESTVKWHGSCSAQLDQIATDAAGGAETSHAATLDACMFVLMLKKLSNANE